MSRTILTTLSVVALLAGCTRPPEPPRSPGAPPSGVVQIRPNARLAWAQAAASPADLNAHTYELYVDEIPSSLRDVQCAQTASSGTFDCSGTLPSMSPGHHVLELTSRRGGLESRKSAPLTVLQMSALSYESVNEGVPSAATSAAGTVDRVSAIAVTRGRLLIAEDARRVLIITGGVLLPEPALTLGDESARIVGLAVDPRFERTRHVFVAWTTPVARGAWELNVTRYRDVQNAWGEAAVIVGAIPVMRPGPAPLAIDAAGLIYIAVPGIRGDLTPFGESVLRFTAEGAIAATHGRITPVFAEAYERPTAIAIDESARRLWLSGERSSGVHEIGSAPLDDPSATSSPVAVESAGLMQTASGMAVAFDENGSGVGLFVAMGSRIYRAYFDDAGRIGSFVAFATVPLENVMLTADSAWLHAVGAPRSPGAPAWVTMPAAPRSP